jgi:hypothetical protein
MATVALTAGLIIDRDTAHDAAQQELSKPIYPKESFGDRINEWISELIYKLLSRSADVPGGWFTVALLLTLVAVAMVIAIRTAQRTLRTRRDAAQPLFDAADLSAAEHRAAAERYAAEGNWPAAIRHRLRAVARQLEENEVVNPVPGRTATELARDAGGALPDLAGEFSTAATIFNDVTYGERPGTEPAYRTVADLDEHLRNRRAGTAHGAGQAQGSDAWAHLQ